jgi:uncharacterized protein YcnI
LWELFRSAGRLIDDIHYKGDRAVRRIATVFGIVAITLMAIAAPAFAHVIVQPSSAPKGSDALLTFVAANEEDNANTVSIAVTFPTDHPIAEALTTPMPGWTAKVTTVKVTTPIQTDEGTVNEAVGTVTWTAASGGGFGPGEFGSFPVSVGLPDDADSLTFKVVQTYSNGNAVNWVQATVPGGDEPEHPAPVLTLTNGEGSATPATTPSSSSGSSSSDDTGKTLGIIALIVGGIGLIIAVVALLMGRARSRPTPA